MPGARAAGDSARSLWGAWLAAVAATAIVLVYGAQIGLGRWQIDEFVYVTDHRLHGWTAFFERFYVSPRPFSELLIYLYGACVLGWQRSLVAPALATLWIATGAILVASAWHGLRPSRGRLAAALALGLAPMAFVLVTNAITEVFYWPAAAVAYLPAVAGVTAVLFLLDGDRAPARRPWCCGALLLAASSHEIGAAFAIGFAVGAVLTAWVAGRRGIARLWWALLPAAVGLTVMAALVLFRSGTVDLGSDTKPYTGHLFASAAAAAWQMARDVVSPGGGVGGLAGLAAKLVFAAGFALVWLRHGRAGSGRWYGAVLLGLATAIYFSLFAAYYHYGDLCCERHATTRQWLIALALAVLAAAAFGRWAVVQTLPGWAGPAMLVLPLALVVVRVDGIRADLAIMGMAEKAQKRTWQSGLGPGPQMRFFLPPDNPAMLIHGTTEPVGTYDLTDPAPELLKEAGRFFGKSRIVVCQPWQSEKSFLINGTEFIPACPPHDGPPDITFSTAR